MNFFLTVSRYEHGPLGRNRSVRGGVEMLQCDGARALDRSSRCANAGYSCAAERVRRTRSAVDGPLKSAGVCRLTTSVRAVARMVESCTHKVPDDSPDYWATLHKQRQQSTNGRRVLRPRFIIASAFKSATAGRFLLELFLFPKPLPSDPTVRAVLGRS